MGPVIRNVIRDVIRPVMGDEALVSRFSPAARDYFARLDAAGLRVTTYDAANARLIDRLVANGGNFWPDSGAFCAMAGYLFPVEDPSIPPLYNHRMYFDGVDDYVSDDLGSFYADNDQIDLHFNLDDLQSSGSDQFLVTVGVDDSNCIAIQYDDSAGNFWIVLKVNGTTYSRQSSFNAALKGMWKISFDKTTPGFTFIAPNGATGSNNSSGLPRATRADGSFYIGKRPEFNDFFFNGVVSNVKLFDSSGTEFLHWPGTGNTDADWEDQVGSNDGTVNGSPALFTGQGVPGSTLIPLHPNHDAGTLNAFVTGDWNAVTGLKGDGSTKYVNSNRNNNADGQDDFAMGVYIETIASFVSGSPGYIGGGNSFLGRSSTKNDLHYHANRSSTTTTINPGIPGTGYCGTSRSQSSEYIVRAVGSERVRDQASAAPTSANIRVFEALGKSDARLPFYHIGANLSGTGELAELDSILTDWQTDLANA